ncbi:MAG: hypothetical protein AAF418_00730, partial [Pseudomonadota bacterium]
MDKSDFRLRLVICLPALSVPGLYTSEELDPLLNPLRDQASQDGFRGPMHAYFAQRVMCNLHVVLIMDSNASSFVVNCEANPALYKCCSFQWLDGWSKSSMLKSKSSFLALSVLNCENHPEERFLLKRHADCMMF